MCECERGKNGHNQQNQIGNKHRPQMPIDSPDQPKKYIITICCAFKCSMAKCVAIPFVWCLLIWCCRSSVDRSVARISSRAASDYNVRYYFGFRFHKTRAHSRFTFADLGGDRFASQDTHSTHHLRGAHVQRACMRHVTYLCSFRSFVRRKIAIE